MPLFRIAFDEEFTDTVEVSAADCWRAAEIAADGLPGRHLPAHDSTIWVFDHTESPPVWKGWRCWHRIEVSIGYVGSKVVE